MNLEQRISILPWLERLRGGIVAELDSVPAEAIGGFTSREKERASSMGPKRLLAYTGARLVLKILALHLYPHLRATGLDALDTVDHDPAIPRLPAPPGQKRLYCSVSHNRRYVTAVASHLPVGVDVEAVSDKALRGCHLFMSPAERGLSNRSPLGDARAAMRVWSIKEAAAKAVGLKLTQAWDEVEVVSLDDRESLFISHGLQSAAHHVEVDGHLFTALSVSLASRGRDSHGWRD